MPSGLRKIAVTWNMLVLGLALWSQIHAEVANM